MSVRAIGWVWDNSESEGAARLVLLAIADCANAPGMDAWPSMAEICRKTRLSERGVQKAIGKLVEIGELEVSRGAGRGRTNRYRIVMETPNPVRGSKPVNPEPRSPEPRSPEHSSPERRSRNPEQSSPGTVRTVSTTNGPPVTPPPAPPPPSAPPATPLRRRPDGLTEIPDDFKPTDSMRRWAVATYGTAVDIEYETAQFISHFRSTGARRKSWPDAWQKWIRQSAKKPIRPAASVVPIDRRQQATNELFDRAMRRAIAREETQ